MQVLLLRTEEQLKKNLSADFKEKEYPREANGQIHNFTGQKIGATWPHASLYWFIIFQGIIEMQEHISYKLFYLHLPTESFQSC